MNELWQACYTNHTEEVNGQILSGWQSVAVSPDIPKDALTKCVALQVPLSTIRGNETDEQGNILNLFEFVTDENYVCILRTQYGLLDRTGRPNLFSQGYVLPAAKVFSDPNAALSLANENFKTDVQSAEPEKEPLRGPGFCMESAFSALGLTKENYVKLIRAVYYRVTDMGKMSTPLYLSYDGTDTGLRALIYVIVRGLPLNAARRLKIGTFGGRDDLGLNLIMTTDAHGKPAFFDVRTGENNLLTERIEARISRLGFADFLALHPFSEAENRAYMEKLSKTASILGDAAFKNELILKISAGMADPEKTPETLSDDALLSVLSDALRSDTVGNEAMDRYLIGLLTEAERRQIPLTEQNEADLYNRFPESAVSEFSDFSKKYVLSALCAAPFVTAVSDYAALPEKARSAVRDALLSDEYGQKILDRYYADFWFSGKTATAETLAGFHEAYSALPEISFSRETYLRKVGEFARAGFTGERPVETLSAYVSLMRKAEPTFTEENAKALFWDTLTYERFSRMTEEEKTAFSLPAHPKCTEYAARKEAEEKALREAEEKAEAAEKKSIFPLFRKKK